MARIISEKPNAEASQRKASHATVTLPASAGLSLERDRWRMVRVPAFEASYHHHQGRAELDLNSPNRDSDWWVHIPVRWKRAEAVRQLDWTEKRAAVRRWRF